MDADAWMGHVSEGGCVLCLALGVSHPPPATIHHPREGQGLSQRADHWLSIGLCPEHHQGRSGWHGLGKRGFYQRYKLDEWDLLALTIARVAQDL